MEYNYSINYVMPNLLIGLCKDSPHLREYSNIFHKVLGYELFRFGLKFPLRNGRIIEPDAIVISTKTENTILFEWTESTNPEHKNDQFFRYSKVDTVDLTEVAAIPPRAVKTFDITITLRPHAVQEYQEQMNKDAHNFPVLIFDQQGTEINLRKILNTFTVNETDIFFMKGLSTDRVPNYLPFPIEQCTHSDIVTSFVQQLVSFLVKRRSQFTLLEFCVTLIPVWNILGNETQKNFSKLIKTLLRKLIERPWAHQLIRRIDDNPPTWELTHEQFYKNPKGYRKNFYNFISEVKSKTMQLSLFDEELLS